MLQHGKLGLVVPPQDEEALAQAIVRYFQTGLGPTFRQRIRAERDLYSWERLIVFIEQVLGA
jgi:glycosyltransferase involved in cell wall biosynthesis